MLSKSIEDLIEVIFGKDKDRVVRILSEIKIRQKLMTRKQTNFQEAVGLKTNPVKYYELMGLLLKLGFIERQKLSFPEFYDKYHTRERTYHAIILSENIATQTLKAFANEWIRFIEFGTTKEEFVPEEITTEEKSGES